MTLNRIDEGFLRLVKNDDAEHERYEREGYRIAERTEGEFALPKEAKAEGFNNARHGVELNEPFVFRWGGAQGVNDGGGVHHELDSEGDQKGEVSVFGSECGNDQPYAQAQKRHLEYQNREEQDVGIGCKSGASKIIVADH